MRASQIQHPRQNRNCQTSDYWKNKAKRWKRWCDEPGCLKSGNT